MLSLREYRNKADRLADFLVWFDAEVGMRPVWLCPLRLRREGSRSGLAGGDPGGVGAGHHADAGRWRA